ncbi:Transposase [Marinobacter sp. LV10R510-11A]|uniref:transposase n=1 Tax=Marinobacter sp. LV10R510-11A TaxID=1415568 RepID=UPI000BB99284|nr:helix-turn-helix domain-containing protein [Marinobacter sp. LV10R510-11A]SOB76813.1 Transposase [Marinobacter sp. LV10R510-11A]SOB76815.1 Transposase [Marinobacter sp. LV10R510-11A]
MPKPESQMPENQVRPDAQLEKRTRRHFSTKYKLKILAAANQCAYGELGQLLRRENLYSNQLRDWRKQLQHGGEDALSKSSPGPKASKTPEQRRIEQLEKELARTQRKLRLTEDCVGLQKKALSMLDLSNNGNDPS